MHIYCTFLQPWMQQNKITWSNFLWDSLPKKKYPFNGSKFLNDFLIKQIVNHNYGSQMGWNLFHKSGKCLQFRGLARLSELSSKVVIKGGSLEIVYPLRINWIINTSPQGTISVNDMLTSKKTPSNCGMFTKGLVSYVFIICTMEIFCFQSNKNRSAFH